MWKLSTQLQKTTSYKSYTIQKLLEKLQKRVTKTIVAGRTAIDLALINVQPLNKAIRKGKS